MTLTDLTKTSLGNLARHKVRTALSAVGVTVGILTIVTMLSLGTGVHQEMVRTFQSAGLEMVRVRPTTEERTMFNQFVEPKRTVLITPALVEEIRDHPAVTFHTPYQVLSFSGDERLAGIEIQPVDGGESEVLEVDGVFLEIGLSPNTGPVVDTVPLNERGEVLVNPDRSTEMPGFFAAGDVTDVAEKQISVAVGDGALAALTAYKYLLDKKLVIRASTAADWA